MAQAQRVAKDIYDAGFNKQLFRVNPSLQQPQQFTQDQILNNYLGSYLNAMNVDEVVEFTITLSFLNPDYYGTTTITFDRERPAPPKVFGFVVSGTEPDEVLSIMPYYAQTVDAMAVPVVTTTAYTIFTAATTGITVEAFSNGDVTEFDYRFYVLKDKKRGE